MKTMVRQRHLWHSRQEHHQECAVWRVGVVCLCSGFCDVFYFFTAAAVHLSLGSTASMPTLQIHKMHHHIRVLCLRHASSHSVMGTGWLRGRGASYPRLSSAAIHHPCLQTLFWSGICCHLSRLAGQMGHSVTSTSYTIQVYSSFQ